MEQSNLAIEEAVKAALSNIQTQPTSWQGQSFSTMPEVTGVQIPIKLQTSQGSIRVYLLFDAQWGENAQKLQELIDTLDNMGFPLDIWQGKGNSGWGNNSYQQRNYKGYYQRRY